MAENEVKITVRPNGPYRVEGPIRLIDADGKEWDLQGKPAISLCRCGASVNKPFCDGSHHAIAFAASGEPASRESKPLVARGGTLQIQPETDGPLVVIGNLEICAGTGRTIDRVTSARLCRCGGSSTKPFCDGTHAKIGFRSTNE